MPVYLMLLFIVIMALIYTERLETIPSITYFPLDKETSFDHTSTELEMISEVGKDTYELAWKVNSKSVKELYLRQDVSLLFDNGQLRGVQGKWQENTDVIQLKEKLYGEDSSYYQAISFHHGEVHYPDDQIKSIQQMTYDQLYVIDSPNTILESFKKPSDETETEWARLLEQTTHQQLVYSWKQLIHYFQIDSESYTAVPLTHLYKFNTNPLPSFTQEQTNQIMGRLWEGLYKNYILNAKHAEKNQLHSYVPLILFAKDNTHLLVLYELNGQKEKLIQKYPVFK